MHGNNLSTKVKKFSVRNQAKYVAHYFSSQIQLNTLNIKFKNTDLRAIKQLTNYNDGICRTVKGP